MPDRGSTLIVTSLERSSTPLWCRDVEGSEGDYGASQVPGSLGDRPTGMMVEWLLKLWLGPCNGCSTASC
jgi:hypothetical protein